MKRLLLTAGLVAFASYAIAQTTVVISPEQETIIREFVVTQPSAPVEPPADLTLEVGTILPDVIELRPVEAPNLDVQYQYVVVDGRTYLVEPETRKVIHIIQ